MLRKLLITSGFFLATSCAFADDMAPYLGIDVGYDNGTVRLKDATNVAMNSGQTGAVGGLFLGYGGQYDRNFYLAIEGFGDAASTSTNTKTINTVTGPTTLSMRVKYYYGGSFIPGFMITPCVVGYARLGVIRARYIVNQASVPSSYTSNNRYVNPWGGEAGIGIQARASRSLMFRLEYDYSSFKDFNAFGNVITPHDNQIKLGAAYIFT